MKISNRAAVESKNTLDALSSMNLPIKSSLSLARLSLEIDKQVNACVKVRDFLMRNYKIKVSESDIPEKVNINTTVTGANSEETQKLKEQFLLDFTNKVNELMNSEGEEIVTKVYLPDNLEINFAILKPIAPFIVLRDSLPEAMN